MEPDGCGSIIAVCITIVIVLCIGMVIQATNDAGNKTYQNNRREFTCVKTNQYGNSWQFDMNANQDHFFTMEVIRDNADAFKLNHIYKMELVEVK